jgi:hypothetical protein
MDDLSLKKRIVDALADTAIGDATGSSEPSLDRYVGEKPHSRYWLGWLGPEGAIDSDSGYLAERFRPSAQGFSFRTDRLPITLSLEAAFAIWIPLHPTFAEQQAYAGLPGTRLPQDQGISLQQVWMKVPIAPVQLLMDVQSPGIRQTGRKAFEKAMDQAFANLPSGTTTIRPRQKGGRLPRPSDLSSESAWKTWETANLESATLPRWTVEFEVEVTPPAEGGIHEVLVTLTNRSPVDEKQTLLTDKTRTLPSWAADARIWEAEVSCSPSHTPTPYLLEQIPDSYRYDRGVIALGFNCSAEAAGSSIRSTFAAVAETDRVHPRLEDHTGAPLDTSFASLGHDPLPCLRRLAAEAHDWTSKNWGESARKRLAAVGGWDADTSGQAKDDADRASDEVKWIEAGIKALEDSPKLLRAFQLMNESMGRAADGYDSWYPFQLAFILGSLPAVADPSMREPVDIVWFPTGGGKTEAYLGLNLVHLFYSRLTGRTAGAHTWARFPLRLLSLQQTHRFADSVLIAEAVRRDNSDVAHGEPFSVGYYVGQGNTPNQIYLPGDKFYDGWDPEEPKNLEACRVITTCPVCNSPDPPEVRFDKVSHSLLHECRNASCDLYGAPLPIYVVDDDIYRRAPTVIVGTVDKLAQLGQNAKFRILLGRAQSRCPKHGYSIFNNRCMMWGCNEPVGPILPGFGGLELEIQDELHLLSESLGALDGNYETIFQAVRDELKLPTLRIIGATATIEGYKEQAVHLYQRQPRRFPIPGPTKGESFWAFEKNGDPLRTFVGLLPRGTTMLNAGFRLTQSHWRFVSAALDDPRNFCRRVLGVADSEAQRVETVIRQLYETLVSYCLRKADLERYAKDISDDQEICPDPANYDRITGDVPDIGEVLGRLEHPPASEPDRIKVLGATSAISHGVDINRLNVMMVMGMPTQTAEFIQVTARVGRRHPAVVFALINPMRERDVSHFRYFTKYAEYLDRLVEPVPVNRESLPVLKRVLSGGLISLLFQVDEEKWMYPAGGSRRSRGRFWHVKQVAQAIDDNELTEPNMVERLMKAFAIDPNHPKHLRHRQAIEEFVSSNFTNFLVRRNSGDGTTSVVDPPVPRSLRDVETLVEIVGES